MEMDPEAHVQRVKERLQSGLSILGDLTLRRRQSDDVRP
jgi:hypothetical protein